MRLFAQLAALDLTDVCCLLAPGAVHQHRQQVPLPSGLHRGRGADLQQQHHAAAAAGKWPLMLDHSSRRQGFTQSRRRMTSQSVTAGSSLATSAAERPVLSCCCVRLYALVVPAPKLWQRAGSADALLLSWVRVQASVCCRVHISNPSSHTLPCALSHTGRHSYGGPARRRLDGALWCCLPFSTTAICWY